MIFLKGFSGKEQSENYTLSDQSTIIESANKKIMRLKRCEINSNYNNKDRHILRLEMIM